MSPLSPQHSSPQRSALTWVAAMLLVWTPQSHLLLRSHDWIEDYGAHVGGSVFLDMPEMGVMGEAQVLAIEPCPPLEPGEGRLVTATFRHEGGTSYDLKLESENEPIGVTAQHPVWSVDRQAWVSAAELEQGERVKTLAGTSCVESFVAREEAEPVYNIEVDGDHVYRVGESGVLVHNASVPDDDEPDCCVPVPTPLADESNDTAPRPVGSNVHPQVPPYPGHGPTLGVLVVNGTSIPLRSGGGPPGEWLVDCLEGGAGSGLNAVVPTHVEGHSAAIMHKHLIMDGDLYINQAPCSRAAMCRHVLNKILPDGAVLRVHFLEDDGVTVTCWLFRAGQSGWEEC